MLVSFLIIRPSSTETQSLQGDLKVLSSVKVQSTRGRLVSRRFLLVSSTSCLPLLSLTKQLCNTVCMCSDQYCPASFLLHPSPIHSLTLPFSSELMRFVSTHYFLFCLSILHCDQQCFQYFNISIIVKNSSFSSGSDAVGTLDDILHTLWSHCIRMCCSAGGMSNCMLQSCGNRQVLENDCVGALLGFRG